MVNGSSKFAGCSSGAIISTCQCAGVSTPEVYKAALTLAHECRSQMFCSGTLDKHLSKLLESTFPQGVSALCRSLCPLLWPPPPLAPVLRKLRSSTHDLLLPHSLT